MDVPDGLEEDRPGITEFYRCIYHFGYPGLYFPGRWDLEENLDLFMAAVQSMPTLNKRFAKQRTYFVNVDDGRFEKPASLMVAYLREILNGRLS